MCTYLAGVNCKTTLLILPLALGIFLKKQTLFKQTNNACTAIILTKNKQICATALKCHSCPIDIGHM